MSSSARLRVTDYDDEKYAQQSRRRDPSPRQTAYARGSADYMRQEATVTQLPSRRSITRGAVGEPRLAGRLGSHQVVSVRGRRVVAPRANPVWIMTSVLFISILGAGVALAMYLSGITTQQAFAVSELRSQNKTLTNQLETLHRDQQNVHSVAGLARRAGELGMVIPDQPGILSITPEGGVAQLREPDLSVTHPVVDVNGAPVIAPFVRTEPQDASAMPQPEPQPEWVAPVGGVSDVPAIAPYTPTGRGDRR